MLDLSKWVPTSSLPPFTIPILVLWARLGKKILIERNVVSNENFKDKLICVNENWPNDCSVGSNFLSNLV
jgi:hypothetical protein